MRWDWLVWSVRFPEAASDTWRRAALAGSLGTDSCRNRANPFSVNRRGHSWHACHPLCSSAMQREADLRAQAAKRGPTQRQRPAVGVQQITDDREPQAAA